MAGVQEEFLRRACAAAMQAGHLFPEYAACEAALESGWGGSKLAQEANNLFGQKQSHPPLAGTETLRMATREYLRGAWVTVQAEWVLFPNWKSCFAARMDRLRKLQMAYPHYAAALAAKTGEEFVMEVSKSWSTDPGRAGKVLQIYELHKAELAKEEVA